MRRIVLIDGENLVYGLRHLLGTEEERAPRTAVSNFNFRGLIEEVLADGTPQEVLWFGARLRRYDTTEALKVKSESAIAAQAHFMNNIQQQKITFIKVGYLRARETDPCVGCGHQEWRLAEKGVDVGLTVRLLMEARPDTEIVLVSADTDLLPAIRAANKLGARVMYVGYEHRPISALSREAHATRIITKPIAQRYTEQRLINV